MAAAGCSPRPRSGTGRPDVPQASAAIPAAPATVAGRSQRRFTSTRWGFSIDEPEGWPVRRGFRGGYLATHTWKTYAAPGSRGTPVVALGVPGSDHVSAAEIRIGGSRSPAEVARCTQPPDSVRAGSARRVAIDGIPFTRFDAGDAAMSHYLDVRSYRTVHDGACYAIDLVVYGTNPAVYSPPATPPFTRAHAFAQMEQVLQGFRFSTPTAPRQAAASASTALR